MSQQPRLEQMKEDAELEQLLMAFPDWEARQVKDAYEETKDVTKACASLGSETDLRWALDSLDDEERWAIVQAMNKRRASVELVLCGMQVLDSTQVFELLDKAQEVRVVGLKRQSGVVVTTLFSDFGETTDWGIPGYELGAIQVDVSRQPRDFVALREQVKKVAGRAPPLPKWIARASNVKAKANVAATVGMVATGTAVSVAAVATGVAPLVVAGAVAGAGAAAFAGTNKATTSHETKVVDDQVEQCDWLAQITVLVTNANDAKLSHLLKRFLSHKGTPRLYERPY